MTNFKSTKRALLMSVLALIMCVAMLIGSTYAWFTDSVTSANNIIKSGNLDVTMEWLEGKSDPTATDAAWKDASTGAIFSYTLWEPGYTEVRHIKIENVGSLALKYKLNIVVNNPVDGQYNLADVIDVYYIDPAVAVTDRAQLKDENRLGTLSEVISNVRSDASTAAGNLKKGEKDTITLAFKMQETATNQYQGLSIGDSITIQLLATQLDSEFDSFGSDYDEGLTPPDENGDIIKNIDGVLYAYNEDGSVRLYDVTPEFIGDTVVVAEGTDSIENYAFSSNPNIKKVILSSGVRNLGRGFDSSNVETVILNEGLEQIDSRAFRATPNLKEVQISSTVKTIADNAFQKSGIKSITIPATVETVGETAFGASKIETVTFEGNTSIQGFAFRGCPELRTVYLKGDDVTFIPSTLNGRNSMWFCNGESNNPNTSNITFYVANETVANRVKTAMGAEANNTPVYIDEQAFVNVKNATELQNALNNATGSTLINFTADITGNATITQKDGVNIVINGNNKKFTGVMTTFGNGRQSYAETLTIKNISFVAANGADSCIVSPDRTVNNLYSYSHNVTVEACTFTDPDGVVNCAAIRHEDGGDKNWKVVGCTVDSTMHSLLQVNNVEGKLTVDGCTVRSKNGANLNSCTNVEITGCNFDVKGYAVRFGVSTGGNLGADKYYLLKNSTLKSACDDGDAVIMFRASAVDAVLTLENTTLIGTTDISGNTADTTINR